MEKNGILVDKEGLTKLGLNYKEKLKEVQADIWTLAEEKFNINSPFEVRRILFEKHKISSKGIKKTPQGKISTAVNELLKIREIHPIVGKIIQSRALKKLISGFLKPLSSFISKDGRIHPAFNQTATVTGRLSSKNPNLQNIPLELRQIFAAPEQSLLLSFDYSQIELRILAILSKDKNLIGAFKENKDIHLITASKIFNLPEEKISEEMQDKAKTINFIARVTSQNIGNCLSAALAE